MIGTALGVVLTASMMTKAVAQDGKITLYGEAPKHAASGSVWNFNFEDPKTGRIIARQEGKVVVKDGKYFAEVDAKGLNSGVLYSVNVTSEKGDELAPVAFVTLQGSTPGTAETGNINVTGTVIAGKFAAGNGPSMPYLVNGNTTTATGGVFGQSASNGVRGVTLSTDGAVAGGSFKASTPNGYGVYSLNTATSGNANAGYFKSSSGTGTALVGINDGLGPIGQRFGVLGEASTEFLFNDFSAGVKGVINNNAPGTVFALGVHGVHQGTSSILGFGLYATGNSGASGTKSFLIDHPGDPANKLLMHYSAEGAEPLLIYSGTATLDASGNATVNLPSYWSTINKDPRYQLTAVGAAMPNLHVGSEVKNNQFRIAGGAAKAKVTWTVTGTRNDPYVQRQGVKDVIQKPASMTGKYFHPELYGEPESKGYSYSGATSTAPPQ